jgi:23S rRNA (cytosine1962-C5)-methyltransferase
MTMAHSQQQLRPPLVLHEDEHLLVVNKPAGMNTHAPSPFAGEGLFEWLRDREPRWAGLAILHRLDKDTSGVLVFGKTAQANRSLVAQFTARSIHKTYLFLTDRSPKQREWAATSNILRAGDRYVSGRQGEPAETRFRQADSECPDPRLNCLEAQPLTGRTHQIRVHAAESGCPILGDTLYGGSPFPRVCLHAARLTLRHPGTGEPVTFRAPVDFRADPALALRGALVDPAATDAFRLIHGGSDGRPGWHVDRLGTFLLSQSEGVLKSGQRDCLEQWLAAGLPAEAPAGSRLLGVCHRIMEPPAGRKSAAGEPPRTALGAAAPDRFAVRENGVQFELSFNEGSSVGLFLDQRDNRRRLLTGYIGADFFLHHPALKTGGPAFEVLNAFAYTCGFSVCAAAGGARTTSLDLSKNYLEWGRRNFRLNGLDPAAHEFIHGDVFDWLRRLAKKKRVFDAILLDPPTFSRSKEHGAFRVESDYSALVRAALPVLKPGGVLFASTNAGGWPPEKFLDAVETAIRSADGSILKRRYIPQPPDFPVSKSEPAYLKTVWMRVG